MKKKIEYADDDTVSTSHLFRMRLPSLALGLILGIVLSFAVSQFEEVLAANVRVAFFMPFVVYMAAAVGAQTASIYTRDLRSGKANFKHYLVKESLLGLGIGVCASLAVAVIAEVWFNNADLTLAVGLGMFGAILTAPLIALFVTEALQLEHTDPAVGTGPIATVLQDTVSVTIYGLVASWIIL